MEKKNQIFNYIKKRELTEFINIYRILKENDIFLVHYLVDKNNRRYVTFLIIKIINDNIKKLFYKQKKYYGASPLNGRTQIDGETEVYDLDKTINNKNHVLSFHKNILLTGGFNNLNKLENYISNQFYYQHNYDNKIGDGLNELKRTIKEMQLSGSDLKFDRLIFSLANGNFVFTISEQDWLNPKTNKIEIWEYFDLFRLDNNQIIEHWDILGIK